MPFLSHIADSSRSTSRCSLVMSRGRSAITLGDMPEMCGLLPGRVNHRPVEFILLRGETSTAGCHGAALDDNMTPRERGRKPFSFIALDFSFEQSCRQ